MNLEANKPNEYCIDLSNYKKYNVVKSCDYENSKIGNESDNKFEMSRMFTIATSKAKVDDKKTHIKPFPLQLRRAYRIGPYNIIN